MKDNFRTAFFNQCKTLDEVKALYRELAKKFHPDRGGDLVTMQSINNDYALACVKVIRDANLSETETENAILSAAAYKEAIDKVILLDGIKIEVVGFWIWVTGETKQHREILKQAKFIWAKKKTDFSAWFFRTAEFKTRNRSYMSLDAIRNKYGSEEIKRSASHSAWLGQ